MILLNAVTADTTGTAREMKVPVTVYSDGTFGGGTLTIQVARDNNGSPGAWHTVKTLTAASVDNVFMFGVYYLRAVISGSTAPALTVTTS